ncbi:GNAT family N-acetyltransferase [Methanolobus sp. WCC5]|uniref:GNAT family N-acetyltransferase n=1 Tax=Methanolobus sp. WCC5 TaxID=3125785 RepID=UPI00324C1221
MFELAKTDDGIAFCKLEHAFELDRLKIGEFSYFRKYLGMADYLSNFRSWLKRPNVALVLAISGNTVVGWSMNERWSSPSSDGKSVYVLRGIEVSPHLARKGVGKNMFFLISDILMGHIITKPVNRTAKLFFESLGFAEPGAVSPVNLIDHPGYLILEEQKKVSLSYEGVSLLDENIRSCKIKMFPKEMSLEAAKKDACKVLPDEKAAGGEEGPATAIPDDVLPRFTDKRAADLKEPVTFDGKFIGDQKMMSPCKCGHFLVHKYQVTGKRKGTAFICASCNSERYFLPSRKNK